MLLLLILLCCPLVGANIYDWEDKPYDSEDFNVEAEFQSNVTITCHDFQRNLTYTASQVICVGLPLFMISIKIYQECL